VIDYKTGSSKSYSAVSQDAPLQSGARLQLPIYAQAARTLLGDASSPPLLAEYWFVLKEPRRPRGYYVDDEVEAELDAARSFIVAAIDAVRLPARPSEPGFSIYTECEYCAPDGLGTIDTHRAWLRKRTAPELADYLALIGEQEAAS